jgi:tRNA(Ile2) C34 agmatinyltransferase TiaS
MSDSTLFPLPLSREQATELARRDICPRCRGELDTGWECNDCGYDARPLVLPQYRQDKGQSEDRLPEDGR